MGNLLACHFYSNPQGAWQTFNNVVESILYVPHLQKAYIVTDIAKTIYEPKLVDYLFTAMKLACVATCLFFNMKLFLAGCAGIGLAKLVLTIGSDYDKTPKDDIKNIKDDNTKLNEKNDNKTPENSTKVNHTQLDGQGRLNLLSSLYDIYQDWYRPNKNMEALKRYVASKDYERHANTAKVYYNKKELAIEDAARIIHQREPVNIAMAQYYDKTELEKFLSNLTVNGDKVSVHADSIYNTTAIKKDGELFSNKPNTASVYSETYLWPTPNDNLAKKEICILSVPAPALDTDEQPHYSYYMNSEEKGDRLNQENYRKEMQHLAKTVIRCALDNKETAFEGKGIKRLVISQYGQSAFLGAVNGEDQQIAHDIYYQTLVEEIIQNKEALQGITIAMSVYGDSENDAINAKFTEPLKKSGIDTGLIVGDILQTAKEQDLIVNAWDPHSVVGNGNDGDWSLDGVLGGGTGIGSTQTPWINHFLASKVDGTPHESSRYIGI